METRSNREQVLARKAQFVRFLSVMCEYFPEMGIKRMEYRAPDGGGEFVDVHWNGGVIKAVNVTADSLTAILKDLSKIF